MYLLGSCCQRGLPPRFSCWACHTPVGASSFRSGPCSDSSKQIHALWYAICSNPGRSVSSMALTPIIFLFVLGFLLTLFLSKVVGIGEPDKQKLIEYSFEKIRCISLIFSVVRKFSSLILSGAPHSCFC